MRKILAICLSLVLLLSLASCGGNKPTETQELTFGHIFAEGSMEDEAADMFAKKLEEITNGTFKVTVYPAGQLGQMAEILEQQQTGTTQFQIISTTAMASIADVAAIDSWPYIFDTREEFERAYASNAGKEWVSQVEKATGFKLVAPMFKGLRQIFVNKEVNSLEELQNLKLRAPGFNTVLDTFKAWGMAPTPMSTAEVYTAMQQNVVNGMEIELSTAYSMGLADVTKTIVMSNHMACNYAILVHNSFYDTLSADVQQAIQQAGLEAGAWLSDQVEVQDADALKGFEAAGVKVITPDVTKWKEIAQNDFAALYPDLAKIADELRKAAKG